MFFIKVFIKWIKTKIIKCNNAAIILTNSEGKFHFLIAWMQEKARFFIPLYKFFSNLHEMAFHSLTTHCSRSISVSGCLARLRMRLFIIPQTSSSGIVKVLGLYYLKWCWLPHQMSTAVYKFRLHRSARTCQHSWFSFVQFDVHGW